MKFPGTAKRAATPAPVYIVAMSVFFIALCVLPGQAPAKSVVDAFTPDGGRYYGSLLDGKLHGQGRIEWDNGDHYEGSFVNGLFSGQGKYRSGSGHTYQGAYRKGQMHGHGRYVDAAGAIYVGEFRNNDFNGWGRYKTPDGDVYEGGFRNGQYHGKGKLSGPDGEYQGSFRNGRYSGYGKFSDADGAKYEGEFLQGKFHGKGRYVSSGGETYEGDFDSGDFTGNGTYKNSRGASYKGEFVKWQRSGRGVFTDAHGNIYDGSFENGALNGTGRMIGKDGSSYEGDFKDWQYHGQGIYKSANGDQFKGSFAYGLFDGEGIYTYAALQKDGTSQKSGTWRYGSLVDKEAEKQTKVNVEDALYHQSGLLAKELASLKDRDPGRVNLYFLAVAGDGTQEVFRREAEFVKQQFDTQFGTQGRSLALVNSRTTVTKMPMATITSIRESIRGIASRMDKENDILFLFLTSHGSKEHELSLNQRGMDLRDLPALELGALLKEAEVRWKVVVVSACYSGGFIDPLKDPYTMVITASRHDRTSFGCADENDFTYFGKAFFKDSLSGSAPFDEAFVKATALVREQEEKDFAGKNEKEERKHSEPQIHSPEPVRQHLRRWKEELDRVVNKAGDQRPSVMVISAN